jgi:hypothetical protein
MHAVVGHEIKSRAATNVITNNRIIDGPTGTASYSIDLPNGGNDLIQGNRIEKGPKASASPIVHFGGPIDFWPQSSLLITGNTITNDHGPATTLVWNETLTPVSITGNNITGLDQAHLLRGYGTESGNSSNGQLISPYVSNFVGNPSATFDYRADPNNETVALTKPYWNVQGGAGLLTILNVSYGGQTIVGGSGGINYSDTVGGNQLFTAAGSTNQAYLSGNDAIHSAGNDTIVLGNTGMTRVSVAGTANITGSSSGNDAFYIQGTATLNELGGSDSIWIRPGGSITLTGSNSSLNMISTDGTANFNVFDSVAQLAGSISGGGFTFGDGNGIGNLSTFASSAPTNIQLDQGTFNLNLANDATVNAGAAAQVTLTVWAPVNLQFIGGSGAATVNTNIGQTTITAGSGLMTVNQHTNDGAVTYDFLASVGGGTVSISDFRPGTDQLTYQGFTGDPIASKTVANGTTTLRLTNNETVILKGVTI